MPSLASVIKPALRSRLTSTKMDIPNFLGKFDSNTANQASIWSDKTYLVDPKTHVFTTIQEHFGNRLIRSINLPPHAVAVDIGCFIGEKLWQLSHNPSYLGIGVDISLPALKAAQKIDIFGHKFLAADLEHLPFKDSSIDLVVIFDVIEHLTHAELGFSEISRILKPGGKLLLHIPLKDNTWSLFWFKQKIFPKEAQKEYDDVGHATNRMLTRSQIKKYLLKNDLNLEQEIPYNSFFVHFWDREFIKITSWILTKFFRSGHAQQSTTRSLHSGGLGKMRSIYGTLFVPFLELLSFPDMLLSKLKIGNTYFVLAIKK